MKVLVTGGAGYIGSHACKALAAAGHEPITYDNLSTGHDSAVRWGRFELGDILDAERLSQVVQRHRPDAVMHFAALAYVGVSVRDPASYHRTNVVGTLNLLDAARAAGVRRIVFSSSCATYRFRSTRHSIRSIPTAGPSWPASGCFPSTAPPTDWVPSRCVTSTRPVRIRKV